MARCSAFIGAVLLAVLANSCGAPSVVAQSSKSKPKIKPPKPIETLSRQATSSKVSRQQVANAPYTSAPKSTGQILVKLKPAAAASRQARSRTISALRSTGCSGGAQEISESNPSTLACKVGKGVDIYDAIAAAVANPDVLLAEPDYILTIDKTSNDPRLDELYGLEMVQAERAWDLGTGSVDVTIAVIDTGVDWRHPDLTPNMWVNGGEIPGNGIDDDRNGYIDDVYGYDFVDNDGDPMDENMHGTHCAGTIGAVGNNGIGVVGVMWTVRIMALKFMDAKGRGSTSDAIKCLDYATSMGANISSNSWGGGGKSTFMLEAIERARDAGQLFVAAAGNSGADNDAIPNYPSGYDVDNVLSVASSDERDKRSYFSCYGAETVDIAAPGSNIWSTVPNNGYSKLSGTSMATPMVAGAAGLILSMPYGNRMNYSSVLKLIMESGDELPTVGWVNTPILSNRRMNVATALFLGSIWVTFPDRVPAAPSPTAAPDGCYTLEISFTPDGYPEENSWILQARDSSGSETQVAAGDTSDSVNLCDASASYTFILFDAYGDGICCGWGQGNLILNLDGQQIFRAWNDFAEEAIHTFRIDGADSCQYNSTNNPIGNQLRKASSVYRESQKFNKGWLYSALAWIPATKSRGQWYQINVEANEPDVSGVRTQGRRNADQWTRTYMVRWTQSADHSQWQPVDNAKVFTGNTDRGSPVTNVFSKPVAARGIRIYPQSWRGHLSLRMALLMCGEQASAASTCPQSPLLINNNIVRSASSALSFNGQMFVPVTPDAEFIDGSLFASQWWIPAQNTAGEWYEMTLKSDSEVTGIVFQAPQLVLEGEVGITLKVRVGTLAKTQWEDVDWGSSFTGDCYSDEDCGTPEALRWVTFTTSVVGRYIRIYPVSWNGWIQLKFGALICAKENVQQATKMYSTDQYSSSISEYERGRRN